MFCCIPFFIDDLTCLISICYAHCSSYRSVYADGQFLGCEFCMPAGMVLNSIIRNCYCGGRATIHVPWHVFGIWFIGLEISLMYLGTVLSPVDNFFFFFCKLRSFHALLFPHLHITVALSFSAS